MTSMTSAARRLRYHQPQVQLTANDDVHNTEVAVSRPNS